MVARLEKGEQEGLGLPSDGPMTSVTVGSTLTPSDPVLSHQLNTHSHRPSPTVAPSDEEDELLGRLGPDAPGLVDWFRPPRLRLLIVD